MAPEAGPTQPYFLASMEGRQLVYEMEIAPDNLKRGLTAVT